MESLILANYFILGRNVLKIIQVSEPLITKMGWAMIFTFEKKQQLNWVTVGQ